MLKVFLGFVVSVVVLLSSAYVPVDIPRAYAASASVIITHIQAGAVGAATKEFIRIYNNSSEPVDIAGWCLTNKNERVIACFDATEIGQALFLPAYQYGIAMSDVFESDVLNDSVVVEYAPLNQSSGSITGSSDTISLVDPTGEVVDSHAWTIPLDAGMQYQRSGEGNPIIYSDTDSAIVVTLPLEISEMLPNAIGSDDDREFIELYNPNDAIVFLAGYILYVGLDDGTAYLFPEGASMQPFGYLSFSNTEIPFTLLNSASKVRLALGDETIGQSPTYVNPKEGQSWAIIDDQWQYTSRPTPGSENLSSDKVVLVTVPKLETKVSTDPKPCADNQYRSLETGRCRLTASSVDNTITPCKDNQYRSEETNRCRNIVVTTLPEPCKEGQERNPETNRCRTVTKMSKVDYGVLGASTKSSNGNWYALATVAGVLLLAIAYAVWEWHDELGKFFRKVAKQVTKLARLHK